MASRNPEDLIPEMQELYNQFKDKMDEAGISFILTCTYRSQEEQDALYEQGRTKPGKIVTWTRKSMHILRKAFDIVIIKNGRPTWYLNEDSNNNDIPDYTEAGKIGMSIGLDWGGSWTVGKKDYPHFQYKET